MERPTDLFSVGLLFQYLNELPPKNSRRMEVGGISRVGTAWTYEKNFNKRFALECSGYFTSTSSSNGTACCFKAPNSYTRAELNMTSASSW